MLPFLFRRRQASQPEPEVVTPAKIDWVIPGRLAIGPIPHEQHHARFVQEQIQAVLTLCAPHEGTVPEWVQALRWQRCALPDSHYDRLISVAEIETAVEQLHQLVTTEPPVYIHCVAAIERSPLITLAYLCRYRNLDLWEALKHLQQVHKRTRPTDAQMKVLQQYLNDLKTQG